VKVVELPGLPEKGDVSDWLAAGHTVKELMVLVKATPIWEPEACDHVLLEEMCDFLDRAPAEIEWLVEDLIPVKTRGLMVADPKVGKSPLALDLALALASQSSWLGHVVPQRRRVAVISREDSPAETARRLKLFSEGTAARSEYKLGQIWVNTMDHSPILHVDNLEQMDALIGELKMEQFDLAIFDVLNVLHSGDENDNTVMAGVLAALKRVQTEAGCGVLLLHHISKAQSTNIFRDARGAGAIHGWPEWGVGLAVVDETVPRREWVRRTEFELKYACPADPVYFKIVGDETALRIELTEAVEKPAPKQRRKVEEIVAPYDGRQRAAGEN
jgi:RecA-family ATPase